MDYPVARIAMQFGPCVRFEYDGPANGWRAAWDEYRQNFQALQRNPRKDNPSAPFSPPPAVDWNDPKNAPPAWSVMPHEYKPHETDPCCLECGGGSAHLIHHGVRTAYQAVEITPAARIKMDSAPDPGLTSVLKAVS